MFEKWLSAFKIILQAIKDLLAALGSQGTPIPVGAQGTVSEARVLIMDAERLIEECENAKSAPADAQAALGSRLKTLLALLMKLLGGLGGILGAPEQQG